MLSFDVGTLKFNYRVAGIIFIMIKSYFKRQLTKIIGSYLVEE